MTDETIICPSLKGTKINLERCLMKQREETKFWGDKSKQMTGCPCQKTGERMSKIGTCENCGRSGLTMSDGANKCQQCNSYVAGTNEDPQLRKQRLEEARELYKDLAPGERLPRGVRKTLKAGVPAALRVKPKDKKLDKPELTDTEKSARPTSNEPPPATASDNKRAQDHRQHNGNVTKTVLLCITPDDDSLYSAILSAAQTQRREPSQQILWMCEGFLKYQKEIREMSLAGGAL